jgi:hypothetical protein
MALFNLKYRSLKRPTETRPALTTAGPMRGRVTGPSFAIRFEAKRRMGLTHKTDKLDARGLAVITPRRPANPCTKHHRGVFR